MTHEAEVVFFSLQSEIYSQILCILKIKYSHACERPPKGKTAHALYRQMVFIWRFYLNFNQGKVIEVWPLFTGWSFFEGGL